jgi:hypothetical protein
MDRSQYQIGDPFVYELLVTNKGHAAVAFPTSTRDGDFKPTPPHVVGALVGLMFDDSVFGQQVLGTHALYGAPSVPNTIVVLAPGETLEIRATGTWYLQSQFRQSPSPEWSRKLEVRGTVYLFSNEDPPPPLNSENTMSVVLRKS